MYRIILFSLVFFTCGSTPAEKVKNPQREVPLDMNSYWYSGLAEISSYSLKQARYGEIHKGQSVFIFVTEPFNPQKLVKSNRSSETDIQVLKLNNTKKFNTGIYPYSMMTSSFMPMEKPEHSLKITSSSQEWCGHTFMELENKDQFEVSINSYFENESAQLTLEKDLLEDDIWSRIRINPKTLPQGELQMIPSFFYLRLKHKQTKAYSCVAKLENTEQTSSYQITYPVLNRTLSIQFENNFPYKILGWTELYPDNRSADSPLLETKAVLMNSIQSDYWNKNSVEDSPLRKELNLH